MCSTTGELLNLADYVLHFLEIQELCAEGVDQIALVTSAVNADDTGAVSKAVLDCILAFDGSVGRYALTP